MPPNTTMVKKFWHLFAELQFNFVEGSVSILYSIMEQCSLDISSCVFIQNMLILFIFSGLLSCWIYVIKSYVYTTVDK